MSQSRARRIFFREYCGMQYITVSIAKRHKFHRVTETSIRTIQYMLICFPISHQKKLENHVFGETLKSHITVWDRWVVRVSCNIWNISFFATILIPSSSCSCDFFFCQNNFQILPFFSTCQIYKMFTSDFVAYKIIFNDISNQGNLTR